MMADEVKRKGPGRRKKKSAHFRFQLSAERKTHIGQCFRQRRVGDRVLPSAKRRDRLVPDGNDFRLRDRYVELDGLVLASENLSLIC
jgi:hypothetical protein